MGENKRQCWPSQITCPIDLITTDTTASVKCVSGHENDFPTQLFVTLPLVKD